MELFRSTKGSGLIKQRGVVDEIGVVYMLHGNPLKEIRGSFPGASRADRDVAGKWNLPFKSFSFQPGDKLYFTQQQAYVCV